MTHAESPVFLDATGKEFYKDSVLMYWHPGGDISVAIIGYVDFDPHTEGWTINTSNTHGNLHAYKIHGISHQRTPNVFKLTATYDEFLSRKN
jgi:hypothetical protein